jgi:hypothetical protein
MNDKVRTTFFVATDGNDAWSGRLQHANAGKTDGPVATLTRARDAVRELKAQPDALAGPITVLVRAGTYFLDETLALTQRDSGTRDCPVTWAACPGEKPVLSGGRELRGFKPWREHILQCDVPAARGGKWRFRQLFFNGRRQIRARYPAFDPEDPLHGGWLTAVDPGDDGSPVTVHYAPGTLERQWAKPTEAEIFIVNSMGQTDTIRIRAIDQETCTITLAQPVTDHAAMPMVFYPGFQVSIGERHRFRVENVLEELNGPGQWCLDSEDGTLYF